VQNFIKRLAFLYFEGIYTEVNESALPYTVDSFNRQTKLLREELSFLGVKLSYDEATRISFLSRRKYERYDHFYPGESFDNRLFDWLEINFDNDERQIAIEIVKNLKFISDYEMKELAIQTFENAKYSILSDLQGISTNNWYNYVESKTLRLEQELAKSIFVACTDDIQFDFFRRYAMRHHSIFQKENFVEYYRTDETSLRDLPEYNRIFLLGSIIGKWHKSYT
jgi:hypothetical protein